MKVGFTVAQPLCHREPSVHSEQKEMRKRLISLIKRPNSQIKLGLTLYIPLIRGFRGKMEWGSRLHVGTPPCAKRYHPPVHGEQWR